MDAMYINGLRQLSLREPTRVTATNKKSLLDHLQVKKKAFLRMMKLLTTTCFYQFIRCTNVNVG